MSQMFKKYVVNGCFVQCLPVTLRVEYDNRPPLLTNNNTCTDFRPF